MHVVVLLALIASLLLLDVKPLAHSPWLAAAGGAVYLVGAGALGRLGAHLGLRAMRPGQAGRGSVRRHRLASLATHAWIIGGAAGLIALGYGKWLMNDLHLASVPLVGKLAAVAPFVAAILLYWLMEYPLHRATRRQMAQAAALSSQPAPAEWTRGQFLVNNLRHHLHTA